jgi:hypothetical protein
MKIAMLKKTEEDYKKKGFLSWVSNAVMADDNPKKNGRFKKGPVLVNRNPTDSFLGYIWRATFGRMSTHIVGIDKVR